MPVIDLHIIDDHHQCMLIIKTQTTKSDPSIIIIIETQIAIVIHL